MLDHLITMIEREMASIRNGIAKGQCPDYTTYREQVAMLTAYQHAIELARRAFEDEEDDEQG